MLDFTSGVAVDFKKMRKHALGCTRKKSGMSTGEDSPIDSVPPLCRDRRAKSHLRQGEWKKLSKCEKSKLKGECDKEWTNELFSQLKSVYENKKCMEPLGWKTSNFPERMEPQMKLGRGVGSCDTRVRPRSSSDDETTESEEE